MKKTPLLILSGLLTFRLLAAADYPRLDQRIDDGWKFSLGDNPTNSSAPLDDSKWKEVTLPHNWSIAGPNEATNSMGGREGFSHRESDGTVTR